MYTNKVHSDQIYAILISLGVFKLWSTKSKSFAEIYEYDTNSFVAMQLCSATMQGMN